MKLGIPCWILILSSLVIFSGTVGAHPHELGKMDHGQSLESYQIELDFATDESTKSWHDSNITLAKKDQNATSSKSNKSVWTKKLDKLETVKENRDQKQKEQ